jgi:ADP-ribose pyrophosphatase
MPKSATSGAAKVLSSESIFQGRNFELKREQVIEPGGIEATRNVIAHSGSVVVLPVFPDGRILMIRQYRHAAGQFLWELVAGHREQNETFRETAPRELQEETGYRAQKFTRLFEIYPAPGLLGEKMELYLAEGLTKGNSQQEPDEKISQRIFTLPELEGWIRSGKIKDAKTVAGILYYSKFLAAQKPQNKPSPSKRRNR